MTGPKTRGCNCLSKGPTAETGSNVATPAFIPTESLWATAGRGASKMSPSASKTNTGVLKYDEKTKNTLATDVNTFIDPLVEAWTSTSLRRTTGRRGTCFSPLRKPN